MENVLSCESINTGTSHLGPWGHLAAVPGSTARPFGHARSLHRLPYRHSRQMSSFHPYLAFWWPLNWSGPGHVILKQGPEVHSEFVFYIPENDVFGNGGVFFVYWRTYVFIVYLTAVTVARLYSVDRRRCKPCIRKNISDKGHIF
jgi:hypothetical protein